MNYKILYVLILVALQSSCSSSSSSPESPERFSYAFGERGKLVSVSNKTGNADVVVDESSLLFVPQQYSDNEELRLASLIFVSNGKFLAVSSDNNKPVQLSSLSGIAEGFFCDTRSQENGGRPRVFFSTAGDDNDCDTASDNPVSYIDTSMGITDDPILLGSNSIFTAIEVEEVYSNSKVSGYLARERKDDTVVLNFYDSVFSNPVRVSNVENYDPATESIRIWPFFNTERSVLLLGDEYYDISVSELALGVLPSPFLTASHHNEMEITFDIAYISAGSDYYRHDIGESNVKEFSTLNLSGPVSIAAQYGSSVIASVDNLNSNWQRFLQVDETGSDTQFRLLTEADYDRSGSNSSSLRMSSTGDATLVDVDLNYDSAPSIQYAVYIDKAGNVTKFSDAKWLNTSAQLPIYSLPIMIKSDGNVFSIIEIINGNPQENLSYGVLPSGIDSVRAEAFSVSGQLLLSTVSQDSDLNGLIYRIKLGESASLEQVSGLSGLSVLF